MFDENIIRFYFSLICCCVLIPTGLFGNIISFIIFNNKKFNKQSGILYFKIDSILNIIILFQLPNQLMLSYWTNTDIGCKISFGLMLITNQIQAWITAFCSLDRLLGVIASRKFGFIKDRNFQYGLIISTSLLIMIADFPFATIMKAVVLENNSTICYPPIDPEVVWSFYYALANIIVFKTVIPFAIMISSSIIIVKTILKSKKNLFAKSFNKREKELAKSLVVLDFFFIVFSLPLIFDFLLNSQSLILYGILYSLTNAYNVFLFLLFYITNKIYRSIFKKYMKNLSCRIFNK
jgi:hypothetical protein